MYRDVRAALRCVRQPSSGSNDGDAVLILTTPDTCLLSRCLRCRRVYRRSVDCVRKRSSGLAALNATHLEIIVAELDLERMGHGDTCDTGTEDYDPSILHLEKVFALNCFYGRICGFRAICESKVTEERGTMHASYVPTPDDHALRLAYSLNPDNAPV